MNGPLLRPRFGRKIGGVCAAFARSYGWDLNLVRLVLVLLVFFGGGGVLAYAICWIVIPEEPAGMPYGSPVTQYGAGYPVDPAYPQNYPQNAAPNPTYSPANYPPPGYPGGAEPPNPTPGAPPTA